MDRSPAINRLKRFPDITPLDDAYLVVFILDTLTLGGNSLPALSVPSLLPSPPVEMPFL